MLFGLKNSAQAFQRLMGTLFQVMNCTFVYLDDILVASRNEREHKLHFREVFQRLSSFGLVIRLEKCVFGVNTIDFLGHQVTKFGKIPHPDKVKTTNFPKHKTVRGLQEFLGMINFNHCFIPHATQILHPLHHSMKQNQKLMWTRKMTTV